MRALPFDYACHLCMSPSTLILEILFLNMEKSVLHSVSLYEHLKQILKHKVMLPEFMFELISVVFLLQLKRFSQILWDATLTRGL